MKKIQKMPAYFVGFVLCVVTHSSFGQEGFYTGIGWNIYAAREEVNSSDNLFQFTHSKKSDNDGFFTQSIGNCNSTGHQM